MRQAEEGVERESKEGEPELRHLPSAAEKKKKGGDRELGHIQQRQQGRPRQARQARSESR